MNEKLYSNDRLIAAFTGGHRFLSNFWRERDGLSAEHRFQAAKTTVYDEHRWVLDAPTPALARQRGQRVTLRPHWEQCKTIIMLNVVRYKFTDPELAAWLDGTGTALLQEGNTRGDTFWGVDLNTGKGENRLGYALMRVRHELRWGV